MQLAFCLNYFFPYGGLQRDFIQIVEHARNNNHLIDVYTMAWDGEFIPGIKIHLIKSRGLTNHGRCQYFYKQLRSILERKNYDLVIGFNKMPGLDIYYAADLCFKAKPRSWLKKLLPRYRTYIKFEYAVFSPEQKTKILILSKEQEKLYQDCYQTTAARFHLLPPPLNPNRKPTEADQIAAQDLRNMFAAEKKYVLLIVASAFKTKGVDRVLKAIKNLDKTLQKDLVLWIVGADNAHYLKTWVAYHNLDECVQFMGARNDLPAIYLAADCMIHPARTENTGTVLLEALLASCPVITTNNCGYAKHIQAANAGIILETPFSQKKLNETLASILTDPTQLLAWGKAGKTYADHIDFFSMPAQVLKVIEDATH